MGPRILHRSQETRLEEFLSECSAKAYTEGSDSIAFHSHLASLVWDKVKPHMGLLDGKSVLDIGCANGFAMQMFTNSGFSEVTGITCSQDDANDAWNRGLKNVIFWDMHDLHDISSGPLATQVDLVWARHVMEHSPVPLFVLDGIRSILKPGTGRLYVEVPAPDTACRHTTNVNHFSCFERNGWLGLFDKAGFTVIEAFDVNVTVPAGPDVYYCYLLGLK